MATAVQVESLWNGLTDNSGEPLAAGKVYTYSAGTTNPVSLYTAADKSTSATNPLILDAAGKAQVWADGRYKFVVKTSADATLYTLDNLLYGFDDTTVLYGGTSTGSANAQTVSVPATVTSYANGQTISFVAGFTNTGATTLQFNSLSAISLVKGSTPSSLQAGDLIAGQLYTATYHGGSFRLQDYPSVADIQRSRFLVASSVGGTNTITGNLTPALSSYETGLVVRLVAANANTGAATLNLNGLGAKTIQRQGAALVGGEIKAGDVVEVFYDGTQFQLLSVPAGPLFVDRTDNRIGINNTNPQYALDISAVGSDASMKLDCFSDTTAPATVFLRRSKGAATNDYSIVANGDILGRVLFSGSNGTAFTDGAAILAVVHGTPGASNDMPVRLGLYTCSDNSGTLTNRLHIGSDGRIGINTETPGESLTVQGGSTTTTVTTLANGEAVVFQASNTSGAGRSSQLGIYKHSGITNSASFIRLDQQNATGNFVWVGDDGNLRIGTANTAIGTNTGTVVGAQTSDERLKNIKSEPFQYGLAEVLALQPIEYALKVTPETPSLGFSAQSVRDIIPEVVFDTKEIIDQENPDDTRLGMDYVQLIPVLVKAVQELSARVEALEGA